MLVVGAVFVDVKGFAQDRYLPLERNVGEVQVTSGGVCRNVAEDIANVELKPTFISVVDESGTSTDVIRKLNRHHVNTDYIIRTEDGLGTWLAVFDNNGDVTASISKRPDLTPLMDIFVQHGDEIFS